MQRTKWMRALWYVKRRNESNQIICGPAFEECMSVISPLLKLRTSSRPLRFIQHSRSREVQFMKRSFRQCLKNNTKLCSLWKIPSVEYSSKLVQYHAPLRNPRVKEHKAAARFTTMTSKKYHFYNDACIGWLADSSLLNLVKRFLVDILIWLSRGGVSALKWTLFWTSPRIPLNA